MGRVGAAREIRSEKFILAWEAWRNVVYIVISLFNIKPVVLPGDRFFQMSLSMFIEELNYICLQSLNGKQPEVLALVLWTVSL